MLSIQYVLMSEYQTELSGQTLCLFLPPADLCGENKHRDSDLKLVAQ